MRPARWGIWLSCQNVCQRSEAEGFRSKHCRNYKWRAAKISGQLESLFIKKLFCAKKSGWHLKTGPCYLGLNSGRSVSINVSKTRKHFSSVSFCFQDANYAYATRQGILTKVRACEHLQKCCEHEQASTHLIFVSNSSKGQILRALSNLMRPFDTPHEGFWVPAKAGLLSTNAWLRGPFVLNQNRDKRLQKRGIDDDVRELVL